MPTISITLTDAEYRMAERKAAEKGITISQYVKQYPIISDEFETRFEYLKENAVSFSPGVKFTVMSIFEDWKDIERGTKLSLGRTFFHLVRRGGLKPVKPAGKNTSNVQLYIIEEREEQENV